MSPQSNLQALCDEEFNSMKDRFRGDESLLKEAILTMCEQGFAYPDDEIPELSERAELLINKWRGDSRSSGLELALVGVWSRAKRLGQKLRS